MAEDVELRPLRADEMTRFYEFIHYAFGLDKEFSEWDRNRRERDALSKTMVPFGYFVDGTMVSTCAYIPFDVRVRGWPVAMGGISEVSTLPEYRRQGYVADMLHRFLDVFRDKGLFFTGLWPFSRAFYRRFGWAVSAESTHINIDTTEIRRLTRGLQQNARFTPAILEDIAQLQSVRAEWIEPFSLSIDRDLETWRTQTFVGWEKAPFVYMARDISGRPVGYLAYTIKDRGDWDRDMIVRDFAYRDVDAYWQLLLFLANHDSQVNRFRLNVPMSDPLFDLLSSGKTGRVSGVMTRVMDPAAALQVLRAGDLEGDAVFGIADSFWPAAAGNYAVTAADGEVRVSRTNKDPGVSMDIHAFSQLFVGYRSVEELSRFGALSIADDSAAILFDALMPRGVGFLPEHF